MVFPVVDNWAVIDFLEIFVYSLDQFFSVSHPDFSEHLSGQFAEKAFNQIQPGSVFRCLCRRTLSKDCRGKMSIGSR